MTKYRLMRMTIEQIAAVRAILKLELAERQWEVLVSATETARKVKDGSDEDMFSVHQCLVGLTRYASSWAVSDRAFANAIAIQDAKLTDLTKEVEFSLKESVYDVISSILKHDKYKKGGSRLDFIGEDDVAYVIMRRNLDGLKRIFNAEAPVEEEKSFSFPQPPPTKIVLN